MEDTSLRSRSTRTAPHLSRQLNLVRYRLAWWSQCALLGALWSIGALLLWRRLAGGWQGVLTAGGLFSVTALLLVLSGAIRWCRSQSGPAGANQQWLSATGPASLAISLGCLFSLGCVTQTGSPVPVLLICWGIVILVESFAYRSTTQVKLASSTGPLVSGWRVWLDQITRIDSPHPTHATAPDLPSDSSNSIEEVSEESAATESPMVAGPLQISRQITRGRDGAGDDVCAGWVDVELVADQRSEVAHVEFCPPFVNLPTIELTSEEPGDSLRVAQVMCHGAVFELRLERRAASDTCRRVTFRAAAGQSV